MNYAQQQKIRNAAAGLIKSLIRARILQEPTFLTPEAFRRWKLADVDVETRTCAQLLHRTRQLRERFEREFLSNLDSVASPARVEETEDLHALLDHIASFIFGDLEEAIRIAAQGGQVRWEELAAWQELNLIRDALDQLPKSDATNSDRGPWVVRSKKVILYGVREKPVVNGRQKKLLGPQQYELVKRLIEAGAEGCTKSKLEAISSGYWKILKSLKTSDPDWDEVIHFPGRSHRGYWIS